jgi:hypothetical protein
MAGRPPSYNEETASAICLRLCEGESLRSICSDPDMPSQSMVYRWLDDERYSTFRDKYARAREIQAEHGFDEITEICSLLRTGKIDANTARVEIDAIKWQLGKLKPAKYSDKIQIDQDNRITIEVINYGTRETLPVPAKQAPKLVK